MIFTASCTQALNTVIKGVLQRGDHVVISSLEHNAVVRPLHRMQEDGFITFSVAEVSVDDDEETIRRCRNAINERTRLMIYTHASNVFGTRLPVERLCALAHQYGILFCLDAAQSAGVFPIDLQNDGYDFVCCAGHKYLYGPMGTGLLLIGREASLRPLIEGGTGSVSDEFAMPDFYPDRLEAGTLNIPGIMGLQAGVRFVAQQGTAQLYQKEMRLLHSLRNTLRTYRRIRLYGGNEAHDDAPVLSFSVERTASEEVARYLSEQHHIAVRAGLHCAPLAHRFMGTDDGGTVRISPSVFTTMREMDFLANSLRKFR